MYNSAFTYSVAKPYPYKWFTWVVIVGGIAVTALFSVINLAATGYEASIVYVTNPNQKEHPDHRPWLQRKPWSWSNKVLSICQSQTLSTGMQIYTTNLALQYTIDSITMDVAENNQATTRTLYSVAYLNHKIENCTVKGMLMASVIHDAGSLVDGGLADGVLVDNGKDISLDARVSCALYSGSGPVTLNLRFSAPIDNIVGSLNNAIETGSNESLSNDTTAHMLAQDFIYYHNALLETSSTPWSNVSLITSGPLIYERVLLQDSKYMIQLSTERWTSTFGDEMATEIFVDDHSENGTVVTNASDLAVLTTIFLDGLAKSLHSSILSDLGQSVDDNIFARPDHALHFINRTGQLQSKPERIKNNFIISPNNSKLIQSKQLTAAEFFALNNISLPAVSPRTIAQQYLCQVPRLKSTGSLVVSIIVADLVFLQALWTIFKWITTYLVERQHPDAHYCIGCANSKLSHELEELVPSSNFTSGSGYQRLQAPAPALVQDSDADVDRGTYSKPAVPSLRPTPLTGSAASTVSVMTETSIHHRTNAGAGQASPAR